MVSEPDPIGWYMDGGLPWRLATLDYAHEIAAERLRGLERAAAAMPRKSTERKAQARRIRDTLRTLDTIRHARHLLAPSIGGHYRSHVRMYESEQMDVLHEAQQLGPWGAP